MEYAQKLFSTRGGTMLLAGFTALLAGIAVFVYVRDYRHSVKQGGTLATVLVAKSLIPKGTPGDAVATKELYQAQSIRESQLREGAVSDPSVLHGRVAAVDIFPGEQLTAADFRASNGTLATTLSGFERAITIPIDSAHGILGNVHAGDRVDVYAGFNVTPVNGNGSSHAMLRLIMQNIPVVGIASSGSGLNNNGNAQVTLRTTPRQAADLAFASDNGRIWLVLRPPTGGQTSPPSPVSVETLMLGIPPQTILHTLGGK
jgi:Flp pilus assembly protein CpaB